MFDDFDPPDRDESVRDVEMPWIELGRRPGSDRQQDDPLDRADDIRDRDRDVRECDEELAEIRSMIGLNAAEESFEFWNNPDDAVYDDL